MIFLHYILLYKKHYAYFNLDRSPQIFYDVPKKFKYIESKDHYNLVKGGNWPNYNSYRKFGTEGLDYRVVFEIEGNEKTIQDEKFYDYFLEYYLPKVIEYTWQGNGHNWKKYETFIINNSTKDSNITGYKKIYNSLFTFNLDTWFSFGGTKILLYADYKTQRRLAMYKRAFHFHPNSMEVYNFASIKKSFKKQKLITIDGITMDEFFGDMWHHADVKINLINFINSPEKYFNEPQNDSQKELLSKWKSLHPNKLLKKIGIN